MRFWWLVCLSVASGPVMAGLFSDDDARKQVQLLEARVVTLEKALTSAEQDKERTIRTLLDIQMQMEAINTELRRLQGQNEMLEHKLQDAEKRQKDFYIDLDTRLRRFEGGAAAAAQHNDGTRNVSADPLSENRAFESAYSFYKAENYANATSAFRDFLKNFPQSAHEANVHYWMGNAYFLQKDCKSCVSSYQTLIEKFPDHPRVAEAMLNVADCQLSLKSRTAANKTLKQIISRFPGSDAAEKAKKRLAAIK